MIISKTPLRMSFAGGGSDFKEYYSRNYGAVLSTAIDKHVYISVNKRFSDKLRVGYSQIEEVHNIGEIKHNLVRESMKKVEISKGTDLVYMSDLLPANEGSGLGASSSLIVGTLNALHAYKGKHVSAEDLAREACEIEIDILKNPIGKQDQYASAYGGFNYIRFNSDGNVFIEPIIMKKEKKDELNDNLLLFYTGINSNSSDILTEQKENTKNKIKTLDKMVELAEKLKGNLENNDISSFGDILHEGWMYKKEMASKITNSDINRHYDTAINAGAKGGKILGSGGGGFLLFYCNKENQSNLRKKLSYLRELPFKFEQQGSRIIYVGD